MERALEEIEAEIEVAKAEQRKLLRCARYVQHFPEEFPIPNATKMVMEQCGKKLHALYKQKEAIEAAGRQSKRRRTREVEAADADEEVYSQQDRGPKSDEQTESENVTAVDGSSKEDETLMNSNNNILKVTDSAEGRKSKNNRAQEGEAGDPNEAVKSQEGGSSKCDEQVELGNTSVYGGSSDKNGGIVMDSNTMIDSNNMLQVSNNADEWKHKNMPTQEVEAGGTNEREVNAQGCGSKCDEQAEPENVSVFFDMPSDENEGTLMGSNIMSTHRHDEQPTDINTSLTMADKSYDEAEDLDGDDGDYDGTHDQISKIEKSKIFMAIQGFRCKGTTEGQELFECNTTMRSAPAEAAATNDLDSVPYKGLIFYKGRCYDCKGHTIVGILSFITDKSCRTARHARCVLVVPFEDTFLGMEEEGNNQQYTADYSPSPYFQVHQQIADLPLSDLETTSSKVEKIPQWIYDPQVPGCWQRFGYFLDDTRGMKTQSRRKELRVVDLFAGAGGMHQGYKNAGFTTAMAVENDPWAVLTLTSNNHGVPVFPGDIEAFRKYMETPAGRNSVGSIGCVHCSSPCQGFSAANRTGGVNDKANNDLSLAFIDFVRITGCTTAVFENVLGMWRREHIHYLKKLAKEMLRLGYQVRCTRLHACDYGDPQKRPRLFLFVSHTSAPAPIIPPATHGTDPNLFPYVTVKDAICGLQNRDGIHQNEVPNMAGSNTSLRPGEHGKVRLDPDGLAPTIRRSPPFHYSADRCIFVREAASLQSFAEDYRFHGQISAQYRQVGNSVPVELATAVARSIRQLLIYEYARDDT